MASEAERLRQIAHDGLESIEANSFMVEVVHAQIDAAIEAARREALEEAIDITADFSAGLISGRYKVTSPNDAIIQMEMKIRQGCRFSD